MSAKKVTFAGKRPSQTVAPDADHWVQHRDTASPPPAPKPQEKMKRLTIDVSVSLHRNIKSQCAMNNLHMADEIRDLLEQRFGGGQAIGEGASS